jgi:PhoH-like ATPase
MNCVKRKILVVDTSVLLYDKNSIFNFKGNDVYIPLVVLEELDKFKDKSGILGENARYINRLLDNVRKSGSLNKGHYIKEKDVTVRVWSEFKQDISLLKTNKDSNDNLIIAAALSIIDKNKDRNIVLISKDINLRVKCDAIGVKSDDYYADYEFIKNDFYKGFRHVTVDETLMNKIYGSKFLLLSELELKEKVNENEFLILKSDSNSSALCINKKGRLDLIKNKSEILKNTGLDAKNKEQIFALHLLTSEDIPLVTLTGIPGSGKTYLALMTALKYIERDKYNRIIFTRPIQTVGKDLGFLPGDVNEKMAPWLAPIVDNFRNQFGDLSYFELMMEKGQIDVAPLSYIRGRSFNNSIIIVDEAQNATIHELKTVITRTGRNSKIILLGDIDQVDLPYVDKNSNGLTIAIEKLKNIHLTGHVNLEKGYRSELANIVAVNL